ncbi:MAG: PD-(D/E)XK nuclease family protein [Myxococcales bacterium]|nr:PD-(D/E)XK nuclease family protein [Myxococcales bacterium]
MSFYELQAPTAWAEPPSIWSSTSIDDIEACPRRWQLLRSRWGDFARFPVRPHPAAIEGQIVHEALDRLTRACGQRGNPPFGGPEFAAALKDADFFPGFARAVAEWQKRLTAHPRPGPAFRLRTSAEDLTNRAVRLFRAQYKPNSHVSLHGQASQHAFAAAGDGADGADLNVLLAQRGALSEVKLTHPELPFLGVLDRVQLSGDSIEIVDFKIGKPSEKHRRQLVRYALLWWRATRAAPTRISAQYLHGTESWSVSTSDLLATERALRLELPLLQGMLRERPARAMPSDLCRSCAVRARCDAGWHRAEEAALVDGQGDAELLVASPPQPHGFMASADAGRSIAVVHASSVAPLLPALTVGQRIRVLDGGWQEKRTRLEIKPWTEVYHIASPSPSA